MKLLPNKIDWDKLERFIGSLKFAVIVIMLFTIAMIAGTFIESFYGTDFANRVIYKSPFFMLIQFGMLLSIIFAAFLRLPPKKRLYGFYIVHLGLVIIGIGALITYVAGVDGSLTLRPYEPNRVVVLSRDVLKITYPEEGNQVSTFLPYTAFKTQINEKYKNILIKDYLPFAEEKFNWNPPKYTYPVGAPYQSSKYHFKNSFAAQDFILTNHPEASNEFQANGTMGPLTFIYYPEPVAKCFAQNNPSKILFWNSQTAECYFPEDKKLEIKSVANNRVIILPHNDNFLTFFPDHSPFPIKKNLGPDASSEIRVISKTVFEKSPYLILFGRKAAFFSKNQNAWNMADLEHGRPVTLPWMSAEISLSDHQDHRVPANLPIPTIPLQKDGALIKGGMRAVSLEIDGKEYWATNFVPLSLNIEGKNVVIEVTQETLNLPFEISLTQFKMDKNPGTNSPASYESFVKLFSDGVTTNHHVFMNNPMKKAGFTFYQASYSEEEDGQFTSTLSVNVDQGRTLKYLGSLMLVLGAILHYNLNNRSKKNKKIDNEQENR